MKVVYGQPAHPEYILLVTVETVAKPWRVRPALFVIVGLVAAAMVVVATPDSVMVIAKAGLMQPVVCWLAAGRPPTLHAW